MNALALAVQLARAVFDVGGAACARLVGRVDVLRLPHVQHRDGLHHQVPDGLLVLGVVKVVGVGVHVPEARGKRHRRVIRCRGVVLIVRGDERLLLPEGGILRVELRQVEHDLLRALLALVQVHGQQRALALLAPVVAQLHGNHAAPRRSARAVGQQAVPGDAPRASLYVRRAERGDHLARLAAEQLHRQPSALARGEVKAPAA